LSLKSLLRMHPQLFICERTHLFMHRFVFLFVNAFIHVSNMFSTHDICVKCTNLWRNELHTIFIINLWPFKFVTCCLLHVTICCLLLLIANYYYSSPIVVCCLLLHVVVHCSLPPFACTACFFVAALFSYTNYPFPFVVIHYFCHVLWLIFHFGSWNIVGISPFPFLGVQVG